MTYLLDGELTIPLDAMPRIMAALKDTQAIHTQEGAKGYGFERPVVPGALLSAYARQAAEQQRSGAFRDQRTLFVQPILAGETVTLDVTKDKGTITVTGHDDTTKYFRSRITYGAPSLEAEVRQRPANSHRIQRPGQRFLIIKGFYEAIGQARSKDRELASLVLAQSVPPLLALKERAFPATDYAVLEHRITALKNYHPAVPAPQPVFTDTIGVTRKRTGRDGRVAVTLHAFTDHDARPTYRVDYTLVPMTKGHK